MQKLASCANKVTGRLFRDRRGAGMTEYIILVGVIAILGLAAFKAFGTKIMEKIQGQTDTVESEVNTASDG